MDKITKTSLLIASTGVLSVLLVFSMLSAVTASKAPNLEKITFVHYASDSSKPVWDDTITDYRLLYGGIRWFNTISYEVNPYGSGLDPQVVRSTLEASSETWDDATVFELYNPPTITSDSVVSGDGKNTVGWGSLDPGIIAVTYLWFNPATKEIVEFDTVFNTYYGWSATGESDKMDLQNIATHELGHNGLGDLRSPRDAELTMYAFSSLGETKKRTLGIGDILGIQKLYGA
jgi:hypothetical protein